MRIIEPISAIIVAHEAKVNNLYICCIAKYPRQPKATRLTGLLSCAKVSNQALKVCGLESR